MKRILVILTGFLMLSAGSCSQTGSADVTTAVPENTGTSSIAPTKSGEEINLTVAVMNGDYFDIERVAESFNAEDNGYHVELVPFIEEVHDEDGFPITPDIGEYQGADFSLVQEIINGDSVDIVGSFSFSNEAKYELLRKKGAFVDLYQFMENDDEVNRETLNSHVLSLKENDGHLYTLPTFYQINTLAGEEKYVGSERNWDIDSFMSHWNAMPDNTMINGARCAEYTYYVVLRSELESFVDYENAQVHFDSPDFRRLLEFCGTFESNHGEKLALDYDSPQFVWETYIAGIMQAGNFRNWDSDEKITLVGYPSEDGSGAFMSDIGRCYSINAKSSPEKQQGAWEFIRTFATEEYQVNNVIEEYTSEEDGFNAAGKDVWYSAEFGLCVNDRAFDRVAQDIIDYKYYDGKGVDKGEEYTYYIPVAEDVEKLKEYIETVDRWETRLDDALYNIVNDEIMAYFAGEKGLDETIELIQNRAALWVSEQYG